jgi:hypothetical protein
MVKKVKVKITILKGRGLAAKDRNILGQRTTSDPYVQIWSKQRNPVTDNMIDEKMGTTPIIKKTLNPVWPEGNHFEFKVEGPTPVLKLKIWDEDYIGDDDLMGVVSVPVPMKKSISTRWYEVPKDSAPNAEGTLSVRLETVSIKKKKKKGDKDKSSKGEKSTKREKSPKRDKSPKRAKSPTRDATAKDGTANSFGDEWMEDEDYDSPPDEDELDLDEKEVVLPPLKVHDCIQPSRATLQAESDSWNRIRELKGDIAKLKTKMAKAEPYDDLEKVEKKRGGGGRGRSNSIFPMVEYLQEENKKLQRETDALYQKMEDELQRDLYVSERMKVQMTIVRGSGLAAKDRDALGRRTTSDPYCEVYDSNTKMLGKTTTIQKTLHPVWNERFDMEVRTSKAVAVIKIWDEDFMSEPDAMGTIRLMVPTEPGESKDWYAVPSYSAKNASGRVQVKFKVEMIPDPRWQVERLEKEVERLTEEVDSIQLKEIDDEDNPLMPIMDFLKMKNKELLMLKQKLETQLQYNM